MQLLVVAFFLSFGFVYGGRFDDTGDKYVLNNEERIDNRYEDYKYRDNKGYGGLDERKRNEKDFYDEEEKEKLDEIFGYTGPTANDEPENLIRPCALEDWECIRQYFAANSRCKPAYGPAPDPFTRDVYTLFFTSVNLTVAFTDFELKGLSNAKIVAFYVNKISGNLVIAVNFQNLTFTSPRGYIRYRRTAKESIVLADFGNFFFTSATITAVIPKVPNLRLDLTDVHGSLDDGFPPFSFGPGAFNSTDPDVVTAFTQFPILLPILLRESSSIDSQMVFAIFVQKSICDFGLKLISV